MEQAPSPIGSVNLIPLLSDQEELKSKPRVVSDASSDLRVPATKSAESWKSTADQSSKGIKDFEDEVEAENELKRKDFPASPVSPSSKEGKRQSRKHWSEEIMAEAVHVVLSGELSMRAASSRFNIPRSSLQVRLNKAKEKSEQKSIPKRKRNTISQKSWNEDSGDGLPSFCRSIESSCLGKDESVSPYRKEDFSGSKDDFLRVFGNVTESSGHQMVKAEEESILCVANCSGGFEEKNGKGKIITSACGAVNSTTISPKSVSSSALLSSSDSTRISDKTCKVARRRKYTPRSTPWSQEDLVNAISAVKKHRLSIRKAALAFGIPKSSLGNWVNGKRRLKEWMVEGMGTGGGKSELSETDKRSGTIDPGNKERKRQRASMKKKTMRILNTEDKHGSIKDLICNRSKGFSDDIQVHIIDEDAVLDGGFIVRENEPLFVAKDGQSENTEELYNFQPLGSGSEAQCAEGANDRDVRHWSQKAWKRSHLKGRVTMTDVIKDEADQWNAPSKVLQAGHLEFRTNNSRSWTQTDMDRAILDVTVNGLSIRKAATKYQIPKSSLADQLTRHKCMKACERLIDELKPLAQTGADFKALQKLEKGKITPKVVAKRFGISFTRLRKLASDGKSDDSAECVNCEDDDVETLSPRRKEDEVDRVSLLSSQKHGLQSKCDVVTESSCEGDGYSKSRKERMRWKRENLEQAIAAVREGRLSIRGSARMFNIPKSTLGDVLRGKSAVGVSPGPKRLLSQEEEASLAGWVVKMARAGLHVKVKEVLKTVKAMLDESGKNVPRLKDNLPKESWWHGFLLRHKEVAEVRRQLKMRSRNADKDNVECDTCCSAVPSQDAQHTVKVPKLHRSVLDSSPTPKHNGFQDGDTSNDEEDCPCAICGCATIDDKEGKLWISCGVVSPDGTLTEGCGGWSHLNCTDLANRNLSTTELQEVKWRCPECERMSVSNSRCLTSSRID